MIDGADYTARLAEVMRDQLSERAREACWRTFSHPRLPGEPTDMRLDIDDPERPALVMTFEGGQTLRVVFDLPLETH